MVLQILTLPEFRQQLETMFDTTINPKKSIDQNSFIINNLKFAISDWYAGERNSDEHFAIISDSCHFEDFYQDGFTDRLGVPDFLYKIPTYYAYVCDILNQKQVPTDFQNLVANSNISIDEQRDAIVIDIDDLYQHLYDYLRIEGQTLTAKCAEK